MRAALARVQRIGRQTADAYWEHKREFEADWKAVNTVLPDERILRRAGDLAERFGLRGYDSVHLASPLRNRLSSTAVTPCISPPSMIA